MTPRFDDGELNGFEVLAAGGVMWRRHTDSGHVLVGVVHRPRYDDWTFPKGKADPGETLAETAVREVWEETGIRPVLGAELADVTYTDQRGRSKLVRYWAMTPGPGEFVVNDEVDELRWVTVDEVADLLTYRHDVALLPQLLKLG